ncbi:MAG: 4Fe-4S binding protein [Clostridiales bacterium]|nr:4Fe-4S binding protein [Clostridiales bacterium]
MYPLPYVRSCLPRQLYSRNRGKWGPFDYDHCKGCGICVKNCHKGAITMQGGKMICREKTD